ncbi:hypothetical protein [Gallaecimonas xiamenensis]|uniref:Uncharacterized protein n=1 Tax=Gallaecimonas xiamenensis 3-C-1 TaxID=745411 RepID=K2JLB9_9GAMM|nr:hypothetical protein [Gallaecimonas xiamenensis]EKE76118.1 hypothetical protein B3C1_04400 [Gallaecimonas xiamenensis 3-C-1]
MEAFWVSFGIFCVGLVLLGVGFSRRQGNGGVLLMWLGTLCMLGIICYRILVAIA